MEKYKKIFILPFGLGILVIVFMVGTAYGHGKSIVMGGSGGMMKMMDLMHGQMDSNRAFDCGKASNEDMMEKGEEMMEEMMGHEDHERVEEAMEKDMQDHDSMHLMMGMWSSGCVGDETMNTLMERYGFPFKVGEPYQPPTNWSAMLVGIVIGAVAGWAGNSLLRKKSVTS